MLADAYRLARLCNRQATDDAELVERLGYRPVAVPALDPNPKITYPPDLAIAQALLNLARMDDRPDPRKPEGGCAMIIRHVGQGWDVHRLGEGDHLRLGGVNIPFSKALVGHSDADVLCHAVIDAVLGGAKLGDIGRLFPDTEDVFRNAEH